jgi:PAS domain S-box-containing protein
VNSLSGQKDKELYCVSGRKDCLQERQRVHDLEVSEARYQDLFEAVKDAILCFDCAGRITRANRACLQVLGWQPQSLRALSLGDLFAEQPLVGTAFRQALKGQGKSFEQLFTWPSDRQVTLSLQLEPIHAGDEVSGVLLVARDLTDGKLREIERRRLYEELQAGHKAMQEKAQALELSQQQLQQAMAEQGRANAELRELGRLKSDFIGIASHELRTPLTFLLGSLEYLEESLPEKINQDERDLLGYAMQGSQRLSDIVENMLDIVRFEAESFQPQKHTVSLHPLVQHVHKDLAWSFQERRLTLDLSPAEQWPEFLFDPMMVRRALEDVIENATKYTESGGQIQVRGRLCSRDRLLKQQEQIQLFWPEFPQGLSWQGDFFEVEVSDNGIGIPRQELAHVFERFYTVGNLDEHCSGSQFQGRGAGLGLALVKRIVRGHGGLVWAQSPGSQAETGLKKPGSCFHLLFPFETNPPADVATSTDAAGLPRVLLVDDDVAIRRFVEVVLRDSYELELAASGPEGLEKAASSNPDLILLDLYMQGMDGFSVCEKLKADPLTRDIPVAIFTALSSKHEKERGMAAGAVDYITKPFFPRELIQRIDLLLAGKQN